MCIRDRAATSFATIVPPWLAVDTKNTPGQRVSQDVYKRQFLDDTGHREQVIVQLPAGRGHVYHKEGQQLSLIHI